MKHEALVRAAMDMRGAAPAEWEKFVMAMRAASLGQAGQLVIAAPDRIHWSQGYAFAFSELAGVFKDAPILQDQLQAQAITKSRNTR